MPKGPKAEKQPGDVVGAAMKVVRIATGEEPEELTDEGTCKAAVELGRNGGQARARQLSPEMRAFIAKKAAKAR